MFFHFEQCHPKCERNHIGCMKIDKTKQSNKNSSSFYEIGKIADWLTYKFRNVNFLSEWKMYKILNLVIIRPI
jgi:hypothetical protein